MMQMLSAGGMTALTDGQRPPDTDNPRGYFELEQVKRLREDSAWLADAEGKAIKVVSALLCDLPVTHQYRVIFMTRAPAEMLASQQQMLARRGAPSGPDDAQMRAHFARHLAAIRQFLAAADHLPTLWCSYNELLRNAPRVVSEIVGFLGVSLDQPRMLAAVEPSLHRQRRASPRAPS